MGMVRLQKSGFSLAVAAALALCGMKAQADDELDALFGRLAEPEQEDWRKIEAEIVRHWSRSGSDAMDLLLERGQVAMEAGDWPRAVEHLSALIDHAPDFAEGWNGRATAFYMMGEYALSLSDVEQVLILNPRHFGALAGLAIMLEAMGDDRLALDAYRAAQAIHPHRPEVVRAVERLESKIGGAEL